MEVIKVVCLLKDITKTCIFKYTGNVTTNNEKGLLHGIGNLHWFLSTLGIG